MNSIVIEMNIYLRFGINGEMQTSKKNKNIIGIIQSFLILILVVLYYFYDDSD